MSASMKVGPGLLALVWLAACQPASVGPAPPPPPADLSAPPQEAVQSETLTDRLIDCAGAAQSLAGQDENTARYAGVLRALADKEGLEPAALESRLAGALARWAKEPAAAQSARVLVCQAEWPSPQP